MSDALSIYLHDHLGAANFAVELLEIWSKEPPTPELREFAAQLHAEVESDRSVLKRLVAQIGRQPHSLKEAAGWVAEKATRYKLVHRGDAALAQLEGLELLALGILGKRALWDALRSVAHHNPELAAFDFAELGRSAQDQHTRVEVRRLQAAQIALASSLALQTR